MVSTGPLKSFLAALAALALGLTMSTSADADPGVLPTTVTAQPSATNVTVGTGVTIDGNIVPSPIAPRTAVLQLQTGTGWRELGRTSTNDAGSYSFAVPTDWYGDHVLRVVAPATETFSEGVSPLRTVGVTPSYSPRGSTSAWKQFSSGARWNPCSVVQYRTNLRRAPRGALKLVNRAFAIVHAATGLTFRNAGHTKKVPFSGGSDRKQFGASGLVVAWASPKAVRALAGSTAGIGGAVATSVNGGPWQYGYGGVAMDATQKLPAKGFKRGQSPGGVLLHELGHVMGLDHVEATSQLMYPSLLHNHRGRYEAGDLTGLHAVGAAQGCF